MNEQTDRPEIGKTYLVNGKYPCRVINRGESRFQALMDSGWMVDLPDHTACVPIPPDFFTQPRPTVKEHQLYMGKVKTDRDLYTYGRAYLPGAVVEDLELYHHAEQFSFPARKASLLNRLKEASK